MINGEAKSENNTQTLEAEERNFYRSLSGLPIEIAQTWRDKYEAMVEPTLEFFVEYKQFCVLRQKALDKSLEIDEDVDPQILLEISKVREAIRETFGDPQHFLGNGYTAEVYDLPVAPSLCIKYIHNQEAYNENNHIRVEHNFLADLRSFAVEGVRAPKPYFLRIHPSEGHSYGMERIMGKNLSQILERPSENIDLIRLAKSLDRKAVKAKLLEYVKGLHTIFKLTHGDLFRRNIMLDEAGNFFVIDFGKAKYEEIGEDHERRRNIDIATLNSEIEGFFQQIDKLEID